MTNTVNRNDEYHTHNTTPEYHSRNEGVCACFECARELAEDEPVFRVLATVARGPVVPFCAEHSPFEAGSEFLRETSCEQCLRPVWLDALFRWGRVFCCERCRRTAANARAVERKREYRQNLSCWLCGDSFAAARGDARFCSNACRQAAYRLRRTAA